MQDRIRATVRTDPNRICRTENAHHRTIERDRKVHQPGIVCHSNGGTANECGNLSESGFSGGIDCPRRESRDLFADAALAPLPYHRYSKALPQKVTRHFGKPFASPALGFPDRAWRDRNQAGAGQFMTPDQRVDSRNGGLRNRK